MVLLSLNRSISMIEFDEHLLDYNRLFLSDIWFRFIKLPFVYTACVLFKLADRSAAALGDASRR